MDLEENNLNNEIEVSRQSLMNFEAGLSSLHVDEDEWEEIALKSKFLRLKLNSITKGLVDAFLLHKTYEIVSDDELTYRNGNSIGKLKVGKVRPITDINNLK